MPDFMYLIVIVLCLAIGAMFCKTFFEHKWLWFFLGILAYPFVFVPLGLWLCPGITERWIHIYAEYLRLWGF